MSEPIRRGRWTSARGRILAAFVVLLVLSELLALALQRQIQFARVGERVDDSLSQEVNEFRRLVVDGNNPETGRPFGSDVAAIFDVFLSRNVPGEGETVFTFLGDVPYRSTVGNPRNRAVQDEIVRLGRVRSAERGTIEAGDAEIRYLAVPVSVDERRRGAFVVTADLAGERREVSEALQVSAGIALLVLVLASGIAWLVAGRILSPLRGLTDTAQSISETDLSRRIEVRGNDEIAQLARTFNGMLDRLESAFASQRAFVSDASHELRTPITIVRGHLELLGDDPDERRETVALVTDELDRMTRFVDDLLTLAKAGGLADRDWKLGEVGRGVVTGDRQRLTQAVMNLAQNAVQHTEPGDRIELGSALRDGQARLWVADEGPGIAPADRERIFERFARAGGSRRRSDGAGLGLAIVRAIAEAHGGGVELDTAPGRGSKFTVVFPADRKEET